MLTRLKTYENYGIRLPDISILVNCIENTLLDREAMDGLAAIINENYDASALGNRDVYRLLDTRIEALDIFKLGARQAAARASSGIQNTPQRSGRSVTMHDLASELFPEWQSHFR
jgi:chromosome partitioning related protein ParA